MKCCCSESLSYLCNVIVNSYLKFGGYNTVDQFCFSENLVWLWNNLDLLSNLFIDPEWAYKSLKHPGSKVRKLQDAIRLKSYCCLWTLVNSSSIHSCVMKSTAPMILWHSGKHSIRWIKKTDACGFIDRVFGPKKRQSAKRASDKVECSVWWPSVARLTDISIWPTGNADTLIVAAFKKKQNKKNPRRRMSAGPPLSAGALKH